MKLCTCTRTCKRLGCCHLLYICLTQNLLHSNFEPLQNLNEISPIFVVDCPTQLICIRIFICSMTKLKEHSRKICYYFCCHRHLLLLFSLFFEGREKMARRPYVSPEALYSSIMDSVGYPEIYSLKRKYLPIFRSHRIKPIKPFRYRI